MHPHLLEDYFERIDTKEKAYWLGFLCADGSVGRQAHGIGLFCRLQLSVKDEDQLDRFIAAVGANPAKKRRDFPTKGGEAVSVWIGNPIFAGHLAAAGCVPLKTFKLQLPALGSRDLDQAFLLGLFDGDGTLIGPRKNCPHLYSGAATLLEQIKERHGVLFNIRRELHPPGTRLTLYLGRAFHLELLANYPGSMPRKRLETPYGRRHSAPLQGGSESNKAPPGAGPEVQ